MNKLSFFVFFLVSVCYTTYPLCGEIKAGITKPKLGIKNKDTPMPMRIRTCVSYTSNGTCTSNTCWLHLCLALYTFHTYLLQWNLRTRDTLGLIVLSLVERLSLSRR